MRTSRQLFRTRLLQALAGLLAAGALLALPASAQAPAEPPTTTTEDSASEEAPDAVAETAPPAEANEDPFDYEASEQISEDLSVSFPVDI